MGQVSPKPFSDPCITTALYVELRRLALAYVLAGSLAPVSHAPYTISGSALRTLQQVLHPWQNPLMLTE